MRDGSRDDVAAPAIFKRHRDAERDAQIPRLLGFPGETEQEFFDLFCTVDKVGIRTAIKALARPIRDIADAIARQDAKWLTCLPGIGTDRLHAKAVRQSEEVLQLAHVAPVQDDQHLGRHLEVYQSADGRADSLRESLPDESNSTSPAASELLFL